MMKSRIMIVLFIALIILGLFYELGTRSEVIDTVLKTERVQNCDSDGCTNKYLIFGERETYQNTDSLIYMKFNSSDIYGHIQQGRTYKFTVYGWRIPVVSNFRNIIKAESHNPNLTTEK